MPVPSCGGKLNSMCADARERYRARNFSSGVPRTVWIRRIWSSSLVPGKSGYNAEISKSTQPTPQTSTASRHDDGAT